MPSTGNLPEANPLVVILGPTAVGKTGLAVEMAAQFGAEVVSADSRQIYCQMDIGTAKPTPEQLEAVPHHLVDIVRPDEDFPLAHFQRRAFAAIDDIQQRGRVPLLVGGTGQYITAVLEGWSIPEVPPSPELRAELEAFASANGVDALYARLLAADPTAQGFVEPRNLRRIVRALEVCMATGKPFSEQRQKHPPPYQTLVFGLTMERAALYARADQRVDAMMAAGFLEEVQALLDKGYSRTLPAMSSLGYAQLASHLLDGVPLQQAVEATKFATHQFIRRQYTWFRGHDHEILWHNVEETAPATLVQVAAGWLHGTSEG